MTDTNQKQLGNTLWKIADDLRGAMNAEDFHNDPRWFCFAQPVSQQRIASCLSSLDTLITAETQKFEALKTHKKALMQQLFPDANSKQVSMF